MSVVVVSSRITTSLIVELLVVVVVEGKGVIEYKAGSLPVAGLTRVNVWRRAGVLELPFSMFAEVEAFGRPPSTAS